MLHTAQVRDTRPPNKDKVHKLVQGTNQLAATMIVVHPPLTHSMSL